MKAFKLIGTFWFLFFLLVLAESNSAFSQTCTASSQVSGSINITSITWVAVPGGLSPSLTATDCANIVAGTNTTTVADFFVDLSNGSTVSITNNITINGSFDIPSGSTGDNSTIQVSGGKTLHITKDLGDVSNNNINYSVVSSTDKIIVDGTLYGKNSNSFNGPGTISGGTLSVGGGSTSCSTPCPISGGFASCFSNGSQNGAFCLSSSALPITLIFFESVGEHEKVKLNWATASEINFDYFSLQKSADGKSFNEIAQVKGHGTTNEKHNYSHEDTYPLIGKNYYRLTSIDFDNYQETFKVIVQDYSGGKDFHVSPNPSNGRTISLNFNFDSTEGQVVIYDSMGAIIDSFQVDKTGEVSFVNNLKNGIYFVRYSSPSFTKAVRFLVKQ